MIQLGILIVLQGCRKNYHDRKHRMLATIEKVLSTTSLTNLRFTGRGRIKLGNSRVFA